MSDRNNLDKTILDEAFHLDPNEKSLLASIVKMEWFTIIQRILEECVRNYAKRLMRTPATSPAEVLANHAKAQAALELFENFMERINIECNIAANFHSNVGTIQNPERPEYIVEDRLELGIKP